VIIVIWLLREGETKRRGLPFSIRMVSRQGRERESKEHDAEQGDSKALMDTVK
jgi:hypothetical protein